MCYKNFECELKPTASPTTAAPTVPPVPTAEPEHVPAVVVGNYCGTKRNAMINAVRGPSRQPAASVVPPRVSSLISSPPLVRAVQIGDAVPGGQKRRMLERRNVLQGLLLQIQAHRFSDNGGSNRHVEAHSCPNRITRAISGDRRSSGLPDGNWKLLWY